MNNNTQYVDTSQTPFSNVGGALVQFLSSEIPFQETSLDVLIGTLPPGVFVPLHSHTSREWFYLL